jgi:hypothetical protein
LTGTGGVTCVELKLGNPSVGVDFEGTAIDFEDRIDEFEKRLGIGDPPVEGGTVELDSVEGAASGTTSSSRGGAEDKAEIGVAEAEAVGAGGTNAEVDAVVAATVNEGFSGCSEAFVTLCSN